MNEFRIRESGQVVTEPEFRAMHIQMFPQVLSVDTLSEYGADPVLAAPQPAITAMQTVARNGAVQDALGNWVYAWKISPRFAEYTDEALVVHTVAEQEAAAIAANLVTAKDAKWEAIKTERDRRTQEGGYYVAPHWYHSDQFSRIQQIGLVMLGANIPAGTLWKTLDNGMIEMTQALAGQIFAAAAASDIAIFSAAQGHKVAMEESADPAAYNFSAGWPLVYGEMP